VEELRAQITTWVEKIRRAPKRSFPTGADVDAGVNVSSNVDTDVDVDAVGEADIDARVRQELVEKTGNNTAAPSVTAPAKLKSKRSMPRTTLPPDWCPTPALLEWVKQNYQASDAQIARQAEQFVNHHVAKGACTHGGLGRRLARVVGQRFPQDFAPHARKCGHGSQC
jgi:hypothetical protein